jgi:hypothetical protein
MLLDNARLERFSPYGNGVLVMLLKDWQIETLANFGVFPLESNIDRQSRENQTDNTTTPSHFLRNSPIQNGRMDPSLDDKHQLPRPIDIDPEDDILANWIALDSKIDDATSARS